MQSKLVIFDCDGVLIDSEHIANRIHAEALTGYGYPLTTEESIKKFTGISVHAACQIVLDEAGIQIPLDYWEKQEQNVFQSFERELTSLVEPILKSLHVRQIPRCVASNSHLSYVIQALKLTKQYNYFNAPSIFSAQQVQRGKPAPDVFLFAAKQMGFDPKNCIVIEDTPAGITAARSAGMQVIAFLGGGHAHHTWYQENIHPYNVPITRNCHELLEQLDLRL